GSLELIKLRIMEIEARIAKIEKDRAIL
nr:Chain A, Cortexillin-1 [Dictyostelium discoideum]4J4A_B Chain B, Cortexillin-1 [Dictyostelium discoideum]4J4A_C Chain C, Cortexillin-1 [Dictyostelium discoideum]4J4A_D Chain D, Cortexillin-1 [Dictyostelium discoideum]4J4A_E Chain E, Cortexillin-1 [Dictyostelium discoideum]4J4A_F Chain F, Cortexillin-1 [Dictyostelium discoideum]4J4A_G Chain G, Cortexillin-1 [Dictyostelium discoideum]4J4A_H Chain H, Cortexillin-1 [Dictyostelium discoideum]4J4A_I Chain I, Cortexillin-1 [Dictyostelium discoi